MNKPSKSHHFNNEPFHDRITLAPGETEKARFKLWLVELRREPRFCRTHQQTQLVVDGEACSIEPAYKGDDNGYNPWIPEVREPGAFHFRAGLCCPTCRCRAAHFPPHLCAASFKSFNTSTPEQEKALTTCREFVAHVNKHRIGMLLMVGRTGTGKTQLAANIVRELETSGVLYVRQAELTTALRATYGNRDAEYDARGRKIFPDNPLEIAQMATVLVVDEIGCCSLANDERLLLDEIIKHRYDHGKPTIFISNLPLDQFKEYVGDALTDRIRHAAGNGKFMLQFKGESYRRTTGEDYLQ